jgi:hypothetical protein
MIRKTILLLFVSVSYLFAQTEYTDTRTGITISFSTDEEMYPESWRGGAVNGEATPLIETEYGRTKDIVAKALEKYPKDVLTKHVKKIYVLDGIHFYGVRYGGTNSLDRVYITNRGLDKGYSDRFIERLFHAELSSILLRNLSYYLNKTTWTACNAENFTYGGTGKDAIKNGKAGEDFDPALNEQGCLTQYATSNFENDVNAFAKNLFRAEPEFWNIVEKYPRVKCKLELIIGFYSQIDPTFTLEYFKKLDA